jgi:hypothetical protein
MTTPRIEKIALVSHFSEVGEWAFQAALRLGRAKETALNIYYFIESPFEVPGDVVPEDLPSTHVDEASMVQTERRVREHFEDALGDFEEVGFRICATGRHNLELRRCLLRREYQLLIIPYLRRGVSFGNMPIEEFAYRFTAPVMLVGPDHSEQYHCNPFADVMHGSTHLVLGSWHPIAEPTSLQTLPVL